MFDFRHPHAERVLLNADGSVAEQSHGRGHGRGHAWGHDRED